MKSKSKYLMIALMTAGLAVGCSSTNNSKHADKLTSEVNHAKAEFLNRDPNLNNVISRSAGYVIFPSVAKGGLGVGAATGRGQLFEGGKVYPVGEASLNQATVGLQAGGQVYSELIAFEDQASLDSFKKGNFEFSAQATAVAITAGASANARYEKGVMVFTLAKGGLMYEASVGGQKFSFSPYMAPTGHSTGYY